MKFCICRTIRNRIHTQSSQQIFVNTLLNWNSLCTMCTVYVGPLRNDFHMPDSKCMKSCFLYLVWDNFLYIAQNTSWIWELGFGKQTLLLPFILHKENTFHPRTLTLPSGEWCVLWACFVGKPSSPFRLLGDALGTPRATLTSTQMVSSCSDHYLHEHLDEKEDKASVWKREKCTELT